MIKNTLILSFVLILTSFSITNANDEPLIKTQNVIVVTNPDTITVSEKDYVRIVFKKEDGLILKASVVGPMKLIEKNRIKQNKMIVSQEYLFKSTGKGLVEITIQLNKLGNILPIPNDDSYEIRKFKIIVE